MQTRCRISPVKTRHRLLQMAWLNFFLLLLAVRLPAQDDLDALLPVRGFCLSPPRPAQMDSFIRFITDDLAPRHVNMLMLMVNYGYQFESRPEMRDERGLSKEDVKKLVEVCRTNHIHLIPQINLLGHQSWAGRLGSLLRAHPELDETPQVKMPENYKWPNSDNLYCKSYCPLHPQLHEVVFALIDEICDVFESDTFHAGMDEVFYIGEPQCPRCGGRDKAELFAGEVRALRDHLAEKKRSLWIWGDRLLDGKTTGLGMWEASMNNTYRAIDLIPKDVMICDWHYDRPDQTAVYFAMKGLNVLTCPWRKPAFSVIQVQDMVHYRESVPKAMREHFQGVVQTMWSGTGEVLNRESRGTNANSVWNSFAAMSDEWARLLAAKSKTAKTP